MKISIIGCGNMGLAYARSFLKYNIVQPSELLLVEKNEERRAHLEKLQIGKVVTTTDALLGESDIIIIAVKPQDFEELSHSLSKVISAKSIVLTIMAGIRISFLEERLKHKNIVRAMPNSPAELGMGMTAFSCKENVSLEQIRKVENLLATTGRTVYFENEDLLDAVTALSGSGPAYFYYIVKHMIEAGKKMGIEESVAAILVKQTMMGSFHLINNAGKSLDDLIKAVASKGGTTEAALSTFEKTHVGEGLVEGILAAENRAKELARS